MCTSGLESDLQLTDELAAEILEDIVRRGLPASVAVQYEDNIRWIREAGKNRLVVGSQARILYADQRARVAMATAFNQAIRGNSCAPFNPPEAFYLLCHSFFFLKLCHQRGRSAIASSSVEIIMTSAALTARSARRPISTTDPPSLPVGIPRHALDITLFFLIYLHFT